MRCIYDIKFGLLQVHKNEISLRKCSVAFAQLRTLQGTLVTGSDEIYLFQTKYSNKKNLFVSNKKKY